MKGLKDAFLRPATVLDVYLIVAVLWPCARWVARLILALLGV